MRAATYATDKEAVLGVKRVVNKGSNSPNLQGFKIFLVLGWET